MEFYQRLEAARIKAGYKTIRPVVKDMAGVAKKFPGARAVSKTTISQHEGGDATPGADVLLCYAVTYKVNPVWLLTEQGVMPWNPAEYSLNEERRMRAYIEIVATWLSGVASQNGVKINEIADMPALDPPEGKSRDIGKPRQRKKGGG